MPEIILIYRFMANTFSSLTFPVIWSTKNRSPLITKDSRDKLYAYIGGIIRKEGGKLICIGGVEDHIHLLMSLNPTIAISNLMHSIKAKSSAFMRGTLKSEQFSWRQDGYGIFSVSASIIEQVIHYIKHQEHHHRLRIFQENFLIFLKKHHIEHNDKYLL